MNEARTLPKWKLTLISLVNFRQSPSVAVSKTSAGAIYSHSSVSLSKIAHSPPKMPQNFIHQKHCLASPFPPPPTVKDPTLTLQVCSVWPGYHLKGQSLVGPASGMCVLGWVFFFVCRRDNSNQTRRTHCGWLGLELFFVIFSWLNKIYIFLF